MSEIKANFGGITNVTSPNPSSIDFTSKKPADESKMQSSATVPSQIKQSLPQAPSRKNRNLTQNETRGQTNLPSDANKVTNSEKQDKEKNASGANVKPDMPQTFEEIISQIFMLKKIFKNHPVNENELQIWTQVFKMTEDYENRQVSTQILMKDNLRVQISEYLSYMQQLKNNNPYVDPIFDDFTILSLGLIEKMPYLSNLACAFFLNKYVELNLDKIYDDKLKIQQFRQKGKEFEKSKTYHKIINCINELVVAFFRQYQAIFKYFAYLVKNKLVNKCLFLQKLLNNPSLLKTMIGNVWHSFSNIVKYQINQPGRQYALFDQINLMINCLNYCFQINKKFFSKEFTVKEVFPLLQSAIRILERSEGMQMKLIDKFVLNLVLVDPFTISTFNSDRQLTKFLNTPQIGQRYGYLFLLSNQVDVEVLSPLKDIQTAVFLQNYLLLNKNIRDYDDAKHRFVFNSICQMFKEKYNQLEENKQKYKHIRKYIDFIVENIWENQVEEDRDQGEEDQIESGQERDFVPESYLNVCRLAKLINSVCTFSFSEGILEQTFNLLLGQNRRNSNKFLQTCFELITIADREQKGDYSRIQNYLQGYSLSCEVIYEFFYKFIIQNATYLERGQSMMKQKGFDSVGQFYEILITSYILNYANRANIYQFNLLAYSSLVKNKSYTKVCWKIADTISSLKKYDVTVYDKQNNQTIQNHLQFIVEKMLQLKGEHESNLWAFSQLILSMLDFNNSLLQTLWIKAMITRMKKLTDSYHPIVLQKYTEVLLHILKHLNQLEDYNLKLQSYFEFKHINDFLHYVLTFEILTDGRQIRNKYMTCRSYKPIVLAVELIKNMTTLYLRQTENRLGRVPHEVKRMMEKENRGSDYQLVFTKEATSYAFALAVILLSQQLERDFRIRKQYPNLHEDLFDCLIKLQRVANHLKYEMNFRVSNLYNRRADIEMNEKLQVEKNVIQKIKRNPSYRGFEYYMNSTEGRGAQNGYILSKLTANYPNVTTLQTQARLVLVSWKGIVQGKLKISIEEGWNNITKLLDKITKCFNQIGFNENRKTINASLAYLFEFSILLKKKNIELYGRFLLEYHHFFIDYKINTYAIQQKSVIFDEAMTYFFGIKSLLPPHIYELFTKNEKYQISLLKYILSCLDATQKHTVRKNLEDNILLIVELALTCVIDVCVRGPNIQKCFEIVFEKLTRRLEEKDSINIREIIILNLTCGILQTHVSQQRLVLKGDYWQLMANCLKPDTSVGEILLLQLQNVYLKHQIFFVSFCNFFTRLAQTDELQSLLNYQHIRLQRTFLEIIEILLIKSIQELKSYYVIWLIEILSEMASNKVISPDHQQNLYFRLSQLFFENKTVSTRINQLLGLLAYKHAVECPLNKEDANYDGSKKFTLAHKQELLAYLRIMTILYFSQNKDLFQENLNSQEEIRTNQAIKHRQIDFQLLAYDLVPLFTKLISQNDFHLDVETAAEKKLSQMRVDKLRANKIEKSGIREVAIDQAHRVWDEKYSLLTLLDEVLNYELISIFSVWVSLVLNFQEGKPTLYVSIYKDPRFDAKANNLVYFLQAVIQKLSEFRRNDSIIDEVLKQFGMSIYQSMPLSKEMLFTNCGSLNSRLEISYNQVSIKLSEVVFVVYKMLQNFFLEKRALKSSSVFNFKKIMKNLKSVEEMIQQVDPHFVVELKSTSYRNDSEYISRNYTVRNR